jgi:hypothetical protein
MRTLIALLLAVFTANANAQVSSPAPARNAWEYHVVARGQSLNEHELTEFGKDGWELVQVIFENNLCSSIFKRQIPNPLVSSRNKNALGDNRATLNREQQYIDALEVLIKNTNELDSLNKNIKSMKDTKLPETESMKLQLELYEARKAVKVREVEKASEEVKSLRPQAQDDSDEDGA